MKNEQVCRGCNNIKININKNNYVNINTPKDKTDLYPGWNAQAENGKRTLYNMIEIIPIQ